MLVRRSEDLVDDVGRQVVRDDHLHEEACSDQEEGAGGVDVARVAWAFELWDQLAWADDRAGDEVREERQVGRELAEPDRLEVAPVDVDDVADPHEREEGDPDREDDRARLERHVDPDERKEVVRRRDEEVEVLEVAEQRHVSRDGCGDQQLSRAAVAPSMDRLGEELVPDRGRGEQEDEAPVPRAVEDVARQDDERPPPLSPRHQKPRERQDEHEEDRERGGRKEHPCQTPMAVKNETSKERDDRSTGGTGFRSREFRGFVQHRQSQRVVTASAIAEARAR